jgi:acyl-CoA thioester hydrolase
MSDDKIEKMCTMKGAVLSHQCDQMGHMNTQFIFALFDQASSNLFAAVGLDPTYLRTHRRGFADVSHVIEYARELQAGALIVVHSRFLSVGSSSLSYVHELMDGEHMALAARLTGKTVLFDLVARASSALPAAVRERIASLVA